MSFKVILHFNLLSLPDKSYFRKVLCALNQISTFLFDLSLCPEYKRQRILKGQSKMDNPKKFPTLGTQDKEKKTKKTTPDFLR